MTTIALAASSTHGRMVVTWTDLTNSDDGAPYSPPVGYDLASVQYIGTIGTSPALKTQGSNEDTITAYAELATGAALGVQAPSAQMKHFRPAVVGGSGTTVTAIALFHRRA